MDDSKTRVRITIPAITPTPVGVAMPPVPRITLAENATKPSSTLGTASLIVGLMSLGCYGLAFLLLRSSADKGRPLVEVLPWAALLILLGMCLPLLGSVLGLLAVGDRDPVPKTANAGCCINSLLLLLSLFLVLSVLLRANYPVRNGGGRPSGFPHQAPGSPPFPPHEFP